MSTREDGRDDRDAEPEGDGQDVAAQIRVGRLRLRVVAAVVALEVLALVGVVVFEVVNLIAGTEATTETRTTIMITLYFVVLAVLLALVARGVLLARAWSRAPVVLVQLIALFGIGIPMVQGDLWYRLVLGVPVVLGSAAAAVLMLTPAVTTALHERG